MEALNPKETNVIVMGSTYRHARMDLDKFND